MNYLNYYINSEEFKNKVRPAPDFNYFDGVRLSDVLRAQRARVPALSECEKHRLVEACISPTDQKQQQINKNLFYCRNSEGVERASLVHIPENNPAVKDSPCYAVIQFREWSNEYRIRSRVDGALQLPPDVGGSKRESWMLTDRGARKIAESCEYVSKKYGGYTTFLTLTFSKEKRDLITDKKLSVQAEASRFFDGLQKIYQRGVWASEMGSESLLYCWVVENPSGVFDDSTGECKDNPHLHVLLRWSVAFTEFEKWADRIETLWGHGYAHLEKIKDHEAAGAYMAKAVGYFCKAQGDDSQGLIHGNRYGISSAARAPLWVTLEERSLHSMGLLIADVADHITKKHGDKFRRRRELLEERETIRTSKVLCDDDKKSSRAKIAARLAKVRAEIKAIPVRANKYQITFSAPVFFEAFIHWARGFGNAAQVDWLPDSPGVDWDPYFNDQKKPKGLWYRKVMEKFQFLKRLRHAFTDVELVAFAESLMERIDDRRSDALSSWYQIA